MMTNPYKKMYVLDEDEYKAFRTFKASTPKEVGVKCSICNLEFPNENILAHHRKTHVDGFQCNICGKVMKTKVALSRHLKAHAPQVKPSNVSVLEQPQIAATHSSFPLLPNKPKLKHKRITPLKFKVKTWSTL